MGASKHPWHDLMNIFLYSGLDNKIYFVCNSTTRVRSGYLCFSCARFVVVMFVHVLGCVLDKRSGLLFEAGFSWCHERISLLFHLISVLSCHHSPPVNGPHPVYTAVFFDSLLLYYCYTTSLFFDPLLSFDSFKKLFTVFAVDQMFLTSGGDLGIYVIVLLLNRKVWLVSL
jgi:hypothetical protein